MPTDGEICGICGTYHAKPPGLPWSTDDPREVLKNVGRAYLLVQGPTYDRHGFAILEIRRGSESLQLFIWHDYSMLHSPWPSGWRWILLAVEDSK